MSEMTMTTGRRPDMDNRLEQLANALNNMKGHEADEVDQSIYQKLYPYFTKALTREEYDSLANTSEERVYILYSVMAKKFHEMLYGETEIIYDNEITLKDTDYKLAVIRLTEMLTPGQVYHYLSEA